MEQELIELLLASKKALSTGQTICAQANTTLQTCEQQVDLIAKLHPKLAFVDNHILVQSSVLERIKGYILDQTDIYQDIMKKREGQLQDLTIELTNIFSCLKKLQVDKDILKVNEERMKEQSRSQSYSIALSTDDNDSTTAVSTKEEGINKQPHQYTCLFDYISDQEIIELQRQADDEIGELEAISNSLINQSKTINIFLMDIAKARKRAMTIPLNDMTAHYASERMQIQEEEIAAMADILLSLTNHYDQLGEATRLYQSLSNSEERSQLDISVLKDDHEHIPNILEDLRSSLDVVESISEEIHARVQVYLAIREELLKMMQQFEQFGYKGGQADTILEKLVDAETQVKERELNLDEFFRQLSSLAEWYRCYASSYNYLLLEIERRRRAQEKQEALRRELLKTLEDSYNDELQERRSWSAQHGQYLPEVLCAFINDPPPIITVEIEHPTGRLPNVSPENIEKALAAIHNPSTPSS